jgi:tRNA modification GTPase
MGSPNVGKSSLLNRLLGEDRAIVTDIPGTTRDIVMGELAIAGVAVQFLDTAGFRPTEDVVENAGIQRSREAAAQADVIWWIEDATLSDLSEDMKNHESAMPTGLTVTRVLNKVDLVEADQVADHARQGAYLVSAKTGAGVEELLRSLEIRLEQETEDAAPALMQARQVEMLEQAQGALARGVELLKQSASPEFVLADIQEALFAVMTISGKKFDDDVMDRVFREFCLGK